MLCPTELMALIYFDNEASLYRLLCELDILRFCATNTFGGHAICGFRIDNTAQNSQEYENNSHKYPMSRNTAYI